MSATIRDPSAQSHAGDPDPQRYRHPTADGAIEVEETSGVVFAEATGRAGVRVPEAQCPTQPRRLPGASVALALLAGAVLGWAWPGRRGVARPEPAVPEAAGAQTQLDAIARRAAGLIEQAPHQQANVAASRTEAERLRQIIDAQGPLLREDEAAPLSEPIPDAVPMTGEEDPIVEVDDPDFMEIVAEFMQSERNAAVAQGEPARVRLAQALLPFADTACDASAVAQAIDAPFADFAATLTAVPKRRPHAADILLVETLIGIAERADRREP